MLLLSGKMVKDSIKQELIDQISHFSIIPELVIIQIGHNAESDIYINQKKIFGEEIGVTVRHLFWDEDASEEEVLKEIDKINVESKVGGIIVQLPIPLGFDKRKILDAINPLKDIDGLGQVQMDNLNKGSNEALVPATSRGILSLLNFYKIDVRGKKVTVVGQSDLVGKPTSLLLERAGAIVFRSDDKTPNVLELCRQADIIVVACGVPKMVSADHVRPGQVVVDVGIHRDDQDKIFGDVDFDRVKETVSAITPVPGGVGPLTVVSLFQNLLDAWKMQGL